MEISGVTLIVLTITIIVMIIIAAAVINLGTSNLKTKNLSNMYADIKSLNDSIAAFYNEYGTLPVKEKYNGSFEFQTVANQNDNVDGYYIIDISKLKNVILVKKITWQDEDVYIINTRTHTIYYPKGVTLDGETYYCLPGVYSKIEDAKGDTPISQPKVEINISINPSTPTNQNVTATIIWPSEYDSVIKEVSIDGGTSYTEYSGISTQISISANCIIKARIKNETEEIKTATLEVTNIDKTNPTVTANQSTVTINEGDSHELSNYFTIVANGKYGIANIEYTNTSNNNAIVTNTNTLAIGTHIIKCTATKETSASASATMTIIVGNSGSETISDEYFNWTITDTEATITGFSDAGKAKYDAGGITVLTIPSEYNGLPVTTIGDGAFYNCTKLVKVNIPKTITTCGSWRKFTIL